MAFRTAHSFAFESNFEALPILGTYIGWLLLLSRQIEVDA